MPVFYVRHPPFQLLPYRHAVDVARWMEAFVETESAPAHRHRSVPVGAGETGVYAYLVYTGAKTAPENGTESVVAVLGTWLPEGREPRRPFAAGRVPLQAGATVLKNASLPSIGGAPLRCRIV